MLYILVSQVDLENRDNEIYWLASGIPVHQSSISIYTLAWEERDNEKKTFVH